MRSRAQVEALIFEASYKFIVNKGFSVRSKSKPRLQFLTPVPAFLEACFCIDVLSNLHTDSLQRWRTAGTFSHVPSRDLGADARSRRRCTLLCSLMLNSHAS